jgi:hypothetical protein
MQCNENNDAINYNDFCSKLADFSNNYFNIQNDQKITNKLIQSKSIIKKVIKFINTNYEQFLDHISYSLFQPIIDEWNDRAAMIGLPDRFSYQNIIDKANNRKEKQYKENLSNAKEQHEKELLKVKDYYTENLNGTIQYYENKLTRDSYAVTIPEENREEKDLKANPFDIVASFSLIQSNRIKGEIYLN